MRLAALLPTIAIVMALFLFLITSSDGAIAQVPPGARDNTRVVPPDTVPPLDTIVPPRNPRPDTKPGAPAPKRKKPAAPPNESTTPVPGTPGSPTGQGGAPSPAP